MLESKYFELINENYYMICLFDENKNLVQKNKKFNQYFHNINSFSDFEKIIIDSDNDEGSERVYVKSPDGDGIIKFELSRSDEGILIIGIKINYEKVITILKRVERKYEDSEEVKSINFNKNKLRTFCTFMVDDLWTIKYYSDNVNSLLNIKNPYLKSLADVFGKGLLEQINEKNDNLGVYGDLSLEYDDKIFTIIKSQYGYIIIHVYPYSNNVYRKFDENTELKYRIENLEYELERRKKFIDLQKDIIKSLSPSTGMMDCF